MSRNHNPSRNDARSQTTRRTFLIQGAAASAGALGLSSLAGRAFAADSPEKIRIGMIGLGWRGGQLLDELGRLPEAEIVALCDPEAKFLDAASKKQPKAKTYADMRQLLDDPTIDAVVIATCNHWHCLAGVWACEAGKDVYVEKPLSNRLWEGRQLINAARKHNRIVQVGTQQRSDPMQDEIRAYLHDDKALGDIQAVAVTRFGVRESIGKRSTPLEMPPTLTYDLWLGPAKDEPIFRNKLDYDWHWDWNTGNGECANWGVHVIDDVRNVAFNDRVTMPNRVASGGGRLVWNDAGQTPNFQYAYLDAGGTPVFFALSNLPSEPGGKTPLRFEGVESGYIVFCDGGSYHGYRGGGEAFDSDGKGIKKFHGDSGAGHMRNFFQAVRARDPKLLNADVSVGHDSTNWAHAINASWRAADQPGLLPEIGAAGGSPVGEKVARLLEDQLRAYFPEGSDRGVRKSGLLEIDPAREEFVGAGGSIANEFLGPRDYRAPYVLKPIAAT
jgi:predicted dehydrogenase